MSCHMRGLDPAPLRSASQRSDPARIERKARRMAVDEWPGIVRSDREYPCHRGRIRPSAERRLQPAGRHFRVRQGATTAFLRCYSARASPVGDCGHDAIAAGLVASVRLEGAGEGWSRTFSGTMRKWGYSAVRIEQV